MSAMIRFGIEKLGTPYEHESEKDEEDTSSTFSCSTFVSAALDARGVEVRATAYLQYYALTHNGYDVDLVDDLRDAQPGDLVYLADMNCSFG